MRFLSASAFWWLLLGAIIIFFYLLKLKRKRRVVPSVFLWQRALAEVEANAPFKRLRRSLLLLLQLVALAALVERLRTCGFALLDVQWGTPHLERFGAVEIPRSEYLHLLQDALQIDAQFAQ